MKYLTILLLTLWMISMFALAGEVEGEEELVDEDQESMMGDEEDQSCWWSECSSHPPCDYYSSWRNCGWGKAYHCCNRHGGGGGGGY
ncbi:unnamed protein product [Cunninghamella echinulata]